MNFCSTIHFKTLKNKSLGGKRVQLQEKAVEKFDFNLLVNPGLGQSIGNNSKATRWSVMRYAWNETF